MQTSLLKFFSKTPKGSASPAGDSGTALSSRPTSSNNLSTRRFPAGSLVWAKISGYPWWPSIVCNDPGKKSAYRKGEIHVQFFDTPVTRAWVAETLVRDWAEKVEPGQATDQKWEKGVKDADKLVSLSCDERLDVALVQEMPSDEEWSDEMSPGSKENKPTSGPASKRRRIIMMDSDDSGDDATFQPKKEEIEEEDDDDEDVSAAESEDISEAESDQGENSPDKRRGNKRKRNAGGKTATAKKLKIATKPPSTPASTPVSKFMKSKTAADSPATPGLSHCSPSIFSSASSPAISSAVTESTKKKLSMFGAASVAEAQEETYERKVYGHTSLPFLRPEHIRDKDKRRPEDPDYNPRTLHVPDSFLREQTPAQRQWWEFKTDYFDVILFFKMGKFYEIFHMDADIAVAELNLVYMKGEVAHAGFPEVAYWRYASTLVEKGYRVARIEQTETPAMMEERLKGLGRNPTKFERVVEREVCQLSTKGTRVNNYFDSETFEGDPRYLVSIYESSGSTPCFGVAFVDTTIGLFNLGQFADDKNLSRLRTLMAHYPPVEVLYERGGLSPTTSAFLASSLPGVRREALRPNAEFWDAAKTLKCLAEGEYFRGEVGGKLDWPEALVGFLDPGDSLGLTASSEGELAVRALGAIVWYLQQGFLEQELLSLKKFAVYKPVDLADVKPGVDNGDTNASKQAAAPAGKYMILDGTTVRNLELVAGSSGGSAGTLLARLDHCLTAMGKRTLRHWVVAPLLQSVHIIERQKAVGELMAFGRLEELKTQLRKIPDLERLLLKIHTAGNAIRSRSHPDSRAVMFENTTYNRRKIADLLSCLEGFRRALKLIDLFEGAEFSCRLLQHATQLESRGGQFPDLGELLDYFDNAFDQASARKEGCIVPRKGVDPDLDAAEAELEQIREELAIYLKEQKRHFGCDVKYWGTGKNRFQLEVPAEKLSRAGSEYELASGTKKLKRYVTSETREFLERQISAEGDREKALLDIQRKMFEQFSKHAAAWRQAIGCLCLVDALLSLATYSSSLDQGVLPELREDVAGYLDIQEGRHPCLDLAGDALIPNDTELSQEKSLIILTGPNMGGKSTLMRQTGLLVVLAQIGCMVPAAAMTLSSVDRIFTRLGAQDNIVGGASTFLVELQETSTILQHSSLHSLVLVDELGRGTATYDGTAIAGAVISYLAKRGCRTLFATHYHNLSLEASLPNVASCHMACMVENEGHEDITQETITFLYKLVSGPCPKSHGFNAAKLAGLPDDIVRRGYAKAREFEMHEKRVKCSSS